MILILNYFSSPMKVIEGYMTINCSRKDSDGGIVKEDIHMSLSQK